MESLAHQMNDIGSPGRVVLSDPKISEVGPSLHLCQVYLDHRQYKKVLTESESILKDYPNEFSAQIFKVEALLGLRDYKNCVIYLMNTAKTFQASNPLDSHEHRQQLESLKNYVKEAGLYVQQQKNGSHDMSQFVPDRRVKYDKVPEYKGPITLTASSHDKGRGVFATEDIMPGQLIIVSRAVEVIFDWEKGDDKLEKLIARKLLKDPKLRSSVYKLHAGERLGHLSPPEPNEDTLPEDLERIRNICKINCFGSSKSSTSSRGLWILPSYLNHDCVDFNCSWKCLGDLLFVRALKPIPKYQELLICYRDSAYPLEYRQRFFKEHGFICQCRLCFHQSKESPNSRERRLQIFTNAMGISTTTNGDLEKIKMYAGNLENDVEEYEQLGVASGKPEWNFSLSFLLIELLELYKQVGDVESEKRTALKYYKVSNGCYTDDGQGIICLQDKAARFVVEAFLKCGNFEKAAKWIGILKNDLTSVYGEADVFKLIFPDLYSVAIQYGIIC